MHRRLSHLTLPALLALSMTACGGGSDDDAIPTGNALPDVQFVDSESYHPLSKVDSTGALIQEGSPGFGVSNPLRKSGDATLSTWAIDTSAQSEDGALIEYSMRIESITADGSAYNSLLANLKIDPVTGLIYQQCSGYPTCYDNDSGRNQDFRVIAVARIAGSKQTLERPFIFRVIAN